MKNKFLLAIILLSLHTLIKSENNYWGIFGQIKPLASKSFIATQALMNDSTFKLAAATTVAIGSTLYAYNQHKLYNKKCDEKTKFITESQSELLSLNEQLQKYNKKIESDDLIKEDYNSWNSVCNLSQDRKTELMSINKTATEIYNSNMSDNDKINKLKQLSNDANRVRGWVNNRERERQLYVIHVRYCENLLNKIKRRDIQNKLKQFETPTYPKRAIVGFATGTAIAGYGIFKLLGNSRLLS